MEKNYSFAGLDISIHIPRERMFEEERHLAPFRAESGDAPHRFTFSLVDALSPPEGECLHAAPGFREYGAGALTLRYIGAVEGGWENAYIRAAHQGKEHHIQLLSNHFPGRIGVKTVLNALATEHLVVEANGVVFHSACIQHDDQAILFTAPSGTGKSTQAELWRALRGAAIRNGDRCVMRWVGSRALACGLPFAGSSVYCDNFSLPLAAVVYLRQAPQTSIRPLTGYEAFSRLWEGCSVNTWNRGDLGAVSELVMDIAGSVPVYELSCTPDESAVLALEAVLKEK